MEQYRQRVEDLLNNARMLYDQIEIVRENMPREYQHSRSSLGVAVMVCRRLKDQLEDSVHYTESEVRRRNHHAL